MLDRFSPRALLLTRSCSCAHCRLHESSSRFHRGFVRPRRSSRCRSDRAVHGNGNDRPRNQLIPRPRRISPTRLHGLRALPRGQHQLHGTGHCAYRTGPRRLRQRSTATRELSPRAATLTVTSNVGRVARVSVRYHLADRHPRFAICRRPRSNQQFIAIGTTSDRRDCESHQPGFVVFKQRADRHDRRHLRDSPRRWPGHSDDHRSLCQPAAEARLREPQPLPSPAGSSEQYTAVNHSQRLKSVSASGQTGQFIALATSGTTGLEVDVTNSPQTYVDVRASHDRDRHLRTRFRQRRCHRRQPGKHGHHG